MKLMNIPCLLIAVLLIVILAAGSKAPEGYDTYSCPAGSSIKVPFAGAADEVWIIADSGDVRAALWSYPYNVWTRTHPSEADTSAGTVVGIDIYDGEYQAFGNTKNARVMVITNDGGVAATGRVLWTFAN